MVFSSFIFLHYFLPIFLISYILAGKFRNWVVLVGSSFFFFWASPKFFLFLIFSLALDYLIVNQMSLSGNTNRKKLLFALFLVLNLSVLFYFKYLNFAFENVNGLLKYFQFNPIIFEKVALPIGISFITFHKISYAVDVYKYQEKPAGSYFDYLIYILLFPHSIAGPIVKFKEIRSQIEFREGEETIENRLSGLLRFTIGLSKKILIANSIGVLVDQVFALPPDSLHWSVLWIALIAYAFQIYFDFSGYSDMAIGLARIMGFHFPENFNLPYLSTSITEFWSRWHITLGQWMRDYVYIPLGGNKKSKLRTYLNITLVFFLSGIWHGASWSFIVWGIYHGLFLIADRLFLLRLLAKLPKPASVCLTFMIVIVGWIFFRAENFTYALTYLKSMFLFGQGEMVELDNKFISVFLLAFILCFFDLKIIFSLNERRSWNSLLPKVGVAIFLIILSLAELDGAGFNPFIYFRF